MVKDSSASVAHQIMKGLFERTLVPRGSRSQADRSIRVHRLSQHSQGMYSPILGFASSRGAIAPGVYIIILCPGFLNRQLSGGCLANQITGSDRLTIP